jgi:hypothetical protein
MSSYYGNVLPSALPGSVGQEPYLTSETKYEGGGYYGSGQPPLGFDHDPGQHHVGFGRFAPYDRMDMTPLSGKTSYPGSNFPPPGLSAYSTSNGQYTSDDMINCKIPDAAAAMVSNGHPVSSQAPGVMNPFSGPSPGLPGVGNGVQAQNIPIYPWMRPMNGGKCPIIYLISLTLVAPSFYCYPSYYLSLVIYGLLMLLFDLCQIACKRYRVSMAISGRVYSHYR